MKLHLTIDSGTIAGRSFDLETGFLTIGRSETCSVRFDPMTERIASKQHAFIEARADGFYIVDNKSTNGTLVNGVKIGTAKLESGDQIQFGANGATATVRIEGMDSAPTVADQQSFREYEVQQFNDAAAQQPVSVSMSLQSFGLGNVAVKPEPPKTGRYIGIAVTIFGIVFLSLIVVLLMFASVGLVPAIIAAVIAFVPSMLYILPLMWLDRYDPEPSWLLALAFAWGALVAVIVSFVVNTVFSTVVYLGT
ncbi:MAG: FHA domain-containing protein, partial [Acidobacteriota bacterium]